MALEDILHRLTNCPACTRALTAYIETDEIRLRCYTHGEFLVKYVNGDWSIKYDFPTW